ncbi:DUF1045 domain-containing protein [Roseinatronobacter sp. S2]|uniref:DUF1045 domain-containing protein n=1 Tax=Roseinatronobacter sp. S2 TaxID=3035471 RepID=UPI002410254C|nr:DUF1045 domain-containing protein [Roseinatronobacter sp. S2]WFE76005.1 DUF1045 domain-containing protein [Roseinatronobacter sp. S2]
MSAEFQRFAIYYTPPAGSALAHAGAAWLGWDADKGCAMAHPDLGLDLAALTETPRKYGLHGTLKPPMALACPVPDFLDAVETLAGDMDPVALGRLRLRPMDGFLAIMPETQPRALGDAAARIVQDLDPYRAPLSEHDIARRRKAGLTARQDALLLRWGYPYVMDEFRFHVTLSGKRDPAQMADALRAAHAWFDPALAEDHHLDALCVFGEGADGRFHLVTRFAMRG